MPSSPKTTFETTFWSARLIITTSASFAASAGVSATLAPSSPTSSAFERVRL